MSLAKSELLYKVAEYLALERDSRERHEYPDGVIYAMAGESPEHGAICTNLVGQLYTQLRGTACQVFSKDMKVRSRPEPASRYQSKGLFSYPDVVVVCGEPQFHDEHRDVLVNPRVIVEVLSSSTESFDRGAKFIRYRSQLASLTDYLVVAQSLPLVEHFNRPASGQWVIAATATDLSHGVELQSIGCALRLSELYDRIVFPSLEDEAPAAEQ